MTVQQLEKANEIKEKIDRICEILDIVPCQVEKNFDDIFLVINRELSLLAVELKEL